MKTPWVIGIVAGAHILAVAGIMLIQGCGTPQGTIPETVETVMPPSSVEPEPAPVAPAPPPKVTAWPPASSSVYVIKKGDSLSKIAARYGLSTRELAALNGIDNPSKILIGQKITLPGATAVGASKPVAKPAPKPAAKPAAKPASGNVYVVKPGDCLSKIAAAHGCKTKALKDANKLTGDKIFVGQKLALPGASAAAKPAAKPASKPAPVKKPAAAVKKPAASAPLSLDSAPVELPDPDLGAAPSMDMREHIVGEDEDLPRIAMRYGVTVTRLKEINGLVDGNVRPGQKIKIPIDG
ncbi:MAG: LysM peptidoglycan-binding domain-containing protein [Kiritimatiellae bacterium]|nr:LysM peptidoglycan-binding domain-containing protein [Kiritimatiellia bacterium]